MFKILVVEDDRALNHTVCVYLSGCGYETTGCLGAQEAYDALYGGMYDLIISDVMMPGVDGFEFAQTVRQTNQEIPILFMTARDDLASKQKEFRIGIDDYMGKPIELDELNLRIGALLRRARIVRKGAGYPDADRGRRAGKRGRGIFDAGVEQPVFKRCQVHAGGRYGVPDPSYQGGDGRGVRQRYRLRLRQRSRAAYF